MKLPKSSTVIAGVLAFILAAFGGAQEMPLGPRVPCDGNSAWPAFPSSPEEPATRLWQAAELTHPAWVPPACTGWTAATRPTWIAALAGEFRFEGNAQALLARIGAISNLPRLRYWSARHRQWLPLARQAAAVEGTDPRGRRADFAASEFFPGRDLYYWMDDDDLGSAVYRMRTLERTEERMVIASENATPIRFFLFTLFQPGDIRAVEFIQRRGPDRWQVYLLSRVDRNSRFFGQDDEASAVNRLVALYRQLAGMPTTGESDAP